MSGLEHLEHALVEIVRRVVREELDARAAEPSPDLITVAEYARARSISTTTVRAAIRDGRLQATRIGRAVRVPAGAAIGDPVRVTAAKESPEAFAQRVRARKGR